MTTHLEHIHKERQSIYGPWRENMTATSQHIDALLTQWRSCNGDEPLPKWFAPLSMVAVKLSRIASGRFHQDNFDDLSVYLKFVESMQSEDAGK